MGTSLGRVATVAAETLRRAVIWVVILLVVIPAAGWLVSWWVGSHRYEPNQGELSGSITGLPFDDHLLLYQPGVKGAETTITGGGFDVVLDAGVYQLCLDSGYKLVPSQVEIVSGKHTEVSLRAVPAKPHRGLKCEQWVP